MIRTRLQGRHTHTNCRPCDRSNECQGRGTAHTEQSDRSHKSPASDPQGASVGPTHWGLKRTRPAFPAWVCWAKLHFLPLLPTKPPELNLGPVNLQATQPLCGRMACLAGAQSKLNLHLGAPSGQSARRSHRSLLMASSKCGAAASALGSGRSSPSPELSAKWCLPKSILATVLPRHGEAPLGAPAQGPLLPSQLTLVLKRNLKARHQQALAEVSESYQSPTSCLLGAVPRSDLGTPALTSSSGSIMGQIPSLQGPQGVDLKFLPLGLL